MQLLIGNTVTEGQGEGSPFIYSKSTLLIVFHPWLYIFLPLSYTLSFTFMIFVFSCSFLTDNNPRQVWRGIQVLANYRLVRAY